MAEYKSVLDKFPPRGSKAYFDMMEKQQALETDTTLESLLAAPVRGAMALASPMRGRVASKSTTTIQPGTIGKDVVRNERQRDLVNEIVKKTGQNPFKAPADVLKKEKSARQFNRVADESVDMAAKNLAGNVGFDAGASEYKRGGKVTASSRADGIAQRGKTRGKIC
jgi:hypothetical protein